jgi:glycosyltransferase involved in cell wall biosynthesis
MNIGIMGTRGIPNRYGGFEQCAQYLAEGLADRGHKVAVYNSSYHPYQEARYNNVDIIHCTDHEKKWGTAGQFFYDRNCIRDAGNRNFDVLLHLGYTSDSVFWRKWSRKMAHIVNMDGMEWKRSKYNRLTRRFLKKAESLAARHADHLVGDSIPVQDYLNTEYGRPVSFIPYGATIFDTPNPSFLQSFNVGVKNYGILVARMEPENNIEAIICGWLQAGKREPLLIISNPENSYGKMLTRKYDRENIRFTGPVYEPALINNLRYFSSVYFHGHSVGGTNPSLLEAMACSCNIIAHDNVFNRSVLQQGGKYFTDSASIATHLLGSEEPETEIIEFNLERIRNTYNWQMIVEKYEEIMFELIKSKTSLSKPGWR